MIGKIVNKSPRKFRLRTTLVVPFVLQVAAAIGLVSYLSFQNGQLAINELVNRLLNEERDRIVAYLDAYFSTPKQVNRINIKAFQLGMIDFKNFEITRQYFYEQMKAFPSMSYINFGSKTGEFIGIWRKNKNEFSYNLIKPPQFEVYRDFTLDEEGNIKQENPSQTAKFEEEGWYVDAIKAGKPVWSSIYHWNHDPSIMSISSSYPVYKNNEIIGVLGIDLVLTQINDFLDALEVSPNAKIFILERNGTLVARSGEEPLYRIKNGNPERFKGIESPNAIVSSTTQYLIQKFDDLSAIQKSELLNFELNGERRWIQIIPWKDEMGLDLLIAVVVPESDFMNRINVNTRNTILLCLAALGIAIAMGIYTLRWVSHPILKVSQASNELARGKLDQHIESSPIIEIDTLAESFNDMARQLKKSFASLRAKNEELRIAEENYRSFFENALEGIFQSSPEGQYLQVNPALARIYGYDSVTEMLDTITNIGEQIYVDPEIRVTFQELLETQGTAKNFEYRSYCKDGRIIWTQIDARVVRDANNNVLYYEGIVQDISDRKRREDELRKQLEELKIEIDHSKREKEVTRLTESSFFQEVQQEMADVDLDEFWS